MKKTELDELIKIYERYGARELIIRLYDMRKEAEDIERIPMLSAYMHLTNKNSHSLFYTSEDEQIISNNTSSVIYFTRNIFDFTNINNKKIVTKESFQVDKESMMKIIGTVKDMYGQKHSYIKNIQIENDIVKVSGSTCNGEFSKYEFELIKKLLKNPLFSISEENPVLYAKNTDGYAYILGRRNK